MKKVFWQTGQRVIKQVLDWLQESSDESVLDRQGDLKDYGIVHNLLDEFNIVVGTNNTSLTPSITVQTGVAYDNNGQRIAITDDTISYNAANATHTTDNGVGVFLSTPRSTGSLNIPLSTNVNNYVWIDYLEAVDDSVFTLHKLANTKIFYKQIDGFVITITTVNTPPTASSLFLGNVNLTGGGVVSGTTINESGRVLGGVSHYRVKIHTVLPDKSDRVLIYTPDQEIFADDHVRAIGTGIVGPNNPHGISPTDIGLSPASTIQEHQEFFHSNGIMADETSTSSALYPIVTMVDPGFDFITFKALTGTERVNVAGNVVVSSDISTDVIVSFSALDANGTWYIYLDGNTKTIQRTQTNLIATPDITKFLLATVVFTYSPPNGDLTSFVDQRLFGTISTKDIHNNAIISEKISTSVAGSGLSGFGGAPLSVNVSYGLEISSNNVQLNPTVAGSALNYTLGVLSINADGSTIDISSNELRVIPSGITAIQLNPSVAGDGLSGGGGSPLSVNVDNSTIETSGDTLRVKANGITYNQLNSDVAGNALSGGGGSPLSVNVTTGIEIFGNALRISSAAAPVGSGLGWTSGVLNVNVDGTYITISGNTVTASNLLKPTHYVADTGTFIQIGSLASSPTWTTVYSYSGHGAFKGGTFYTNNPGSGGGSFDFQIIIDGNSYVFTDLRTGVNGGQGWPTPNNYAFVANQINSASAIGIVSGTDTHSQFYFGFVTGFTLQIRPRAFSDGRWGFTPYVAYERV